MDRRGDVVGTSRIVGAWRCGGTKVDAVVGWRPFHRGHIVPISCTILILSDFGRSRPFRRRRGAYK